MRASTEFEAFRGSTALVTGGSGFIGVALCTRLAEAGAKVHSVSRHDQAARSATRHWRVDLSDEQASRAVVRDVRPDYVFHLASRVTGSPEVREVLPTFHGNLRTTVNLLCALSESSCRRIVTTGSLVEPTGQLSEEAPSSPYAAAKWASAQYVRMFHALYGLPVSIARVFMVYGPGQRDETKLVPYTIRCVEAGQPPLISSGDRMIDWVYVSDVIEGLLRLAIEGVGGEAVDLGSGALVTIAGIVDLICELMGGQVRAQYGARPDRPLEPTRVARVDESMRMIGWRAKVRLREGLERTIEWYRRHPRASSQTT